MADLRAAMSRLRPVVLLVMLLVIGSRSGWCVQPPSSLSSEDEKVSFRWAFGVLTMGDEGPRLEAVRSHAALKAGDKLKMMVELQKKCFVYVIYQNAQGEVSMLFPYSMEQFANDYQPHKRYFIPKKDAWFQLDEHIGSETFYLMASTRRLSEVEYLMNRYESADPQKKPQIADQMAAEIREIGGGQKEMLSQGEKTASSESLTRGVERAQGRDTADVSAFAEEIASFGVYVRTITIDHR